MNSKATTCPPTDTLNDFVEGKLEPPTSDECELHISKCPACLETLRGLGTEDTLTGHVAAAMNEPNSSGSSVQLDNLLERLLIQPARDLKSPAPHPNARVPAELMADRAAEVLRCLEPGDDQSLGALGDYDLERLIGTGSSGVVFQATDRTLHRTVALKVLRPSLGEMARQRFISEARSAAAIEHPNVVTIYQVGQSDRLAFMAMQWIPGQSLEQHLAAGSLFEETEIRQIARQIAAGLQAAHERQIIHRDIKPANVWLTEQDRSVKILDFGLARISDDDPGLTATGMLAGTPNFMSPEQSKGLELDGRSDLFSLGCLMYRLITGRLPFGASTVLATLQAIQNDRPPSVQSLQPNSSDDLTDITMALLEKQPANRPESAGQLVEILDNERAHWPVQINRYSAKLPTDDPVTRPRQISNARSNGNFFRWIFATIALGMLGFGGFLFGPQIIRVATDQGEVVIETNDPNVEIEILEGNKVIRVVDTKTNQSFNIRSGSYEIRAKANSTSSEADQNVAFDVTPQRLIMKRGQQQIVTVTKKANGSQAKPNAITELDLKQNVEGDYQINKSEIEGRISQAQTAVDKARRDMENTRASVQNGFSDFEQLREAQQLVKSAELRLKNARAPSGSAFLDGLFGAVSPRDQPSVKDKELVSDRPSLVRYSVTTDPTSALRVLQTMLDGSDAHIMADERSGAIIVRGRGEVHQVVVEALAAIENVDDSLRVDGTDLPSDDPKIQDKELDSERSTVRRYSVTIDPKIALRVLQTMLDGTDAQIVADERSGAIIVRGRKEDHKIVVDSLATIEDADDNQRVDSRMGLVYDGQNFEHWSKVAKTDQRARTVADAIRACGSLAETVPQRKELYEFITTAARRHGTYLDGGVTFGNGGENDDEYVMRAVLTAIRNQPPELAVDFVEQELNNGNKRSLQFCSSMLTDNIPYNNVIAGAENKFKEAFAGRLNVLLPLAMKTDPPVDSLIYTAGYFPREELLKLNPNLDRLVTKLFWEQTKEQTENSQDSYYVAILGQLAAYLRVNDEKIVMYLANQYEKSKSVEQTYYGDWYFPTLTSDTLTNNRTLGASYRPIVGWHDEMRFEILLEILQTKLSEEAVKPAATGPYGPNSGWNYLAEYQLLECLYVLLPKMKEKVRQQAKETFNATKRDLPERFKSIDGQELDIENNLDALIAVCDGNTEPTFIKKPQGGYGGGNFGGGVF